MGTVVVRDSAHVLKPVIIPTRADLAVSISIVRSLLPALMQRPYPVKDPNSRTAKRNPAIARVTISLRQRVCVLGPLCKGRDTSQCVRDSGRFGCGREPCVRGTLVFGFQHRRGIYEAACPRDSRCYPARFVRVASIQGFGKDIVVQPG